MQGDHIQTCMQHTGSTEAAHETALAALADMCSQTGITALMTFLSPSAGRLCRAKRLHRSVRRGFCSMGS